MTTIDVPGALAGSTIVYANNNAGVLVGQFSDAAGVHGFVDVGGTFTTLNAPGAGSTTAYQISDSGEIVGSYQDAAGATHGFTASLFH